MWGSVAQYSVRSWIPVQCDGLCLSPSDLIAIPDFESGAMENWGLTTYRETSLLYDPRSSSAQDKLWVTMVIAHELAHQVPTSQDDLLVC